MLTAKEEVLLDVNAMAEGHNYFAATGFAVSMDNKLLAYGVDMLSRREYIIYIKNLETGEIYKDAVKDTEGDPVWANDNQTIFYTAKNLSITHLWYSQVCFSFLYSCRFA